MERKNTPYEEIGFIDTKKLIDDVHQGLQELVRLLEDGRLDLSDGAVRERLLELDVHSRRFLGALNEVQIEKGWNIEYRSGLDRYRTGHRFIQQIDLLVEHNLDNHKFGVNELARALGMSRSQIHRKLTSITSQSANCYIRNYRLHRAGRMLRESSYNVSDIAYQVGFGSQTYFSRCFREIFMTSPTAYRKTFENSKICSSYTNRD